MNASNIEAVLDELLKGNSEAFTVIVRMFSLPLRSYLGNHLHHLDEVDDLAQEVFLAAFRSLSSFRRGDDFGVWLRGIARHKLQDHFRNEARFHSAMDRFRAESHLLFEEDLEALARNETSERIAALLRCISELPEKLKRVVRAGLDGHKPAALADNMQTTVGAIYNMHYRANKLLRECVEREINQ